MFMIDIIIEEVIKILLESKVSKRESTSRKILRRNSLEKNGEEMTKAESDLELKKIKSLIPNSSNSESLECLYLPSITKMYCKGEFKNSDITKKVNLIIGYLCKKNIVEDLEKITAQGLIDKYDEVVNDVKKSDNATAEQNAQNNVGTKGYVIKKITSFEEANKYFKNVTWCVTKSNEAFKKYTEGGTLPFFFCLKDGYDTIQRPQEKTGNPKDEYGLSMIGVVFDGEGIKSSTTRWNHDNGGNDNMFTMTELVDIVGGDILKCKDDAIATVNKFYNDIEKELKSGKSLNDVFDSVKEYENISICKLDTKIYILNKKNEFIFKNYFTGFNGFSQGFSVIGKYDKWNYINTNGELLSNEWFYRCYEFSGGFGVVNKDNHFNYVNNEGEVLSDEWFDWCEPFLETVAKIKKNNKFNFIKTTGELLSNEWFDQCYDFKEGFSVIIKNDKYNFINTNGVLLSKEWFEECDSFSEGFGLIKVNNVCNFINNKGEILSNQWFESCGHFSNGYAPIYLNGKYNFINNNIELISKDWFEECDSFSEGFGRIKNNGGWSYINTYGEIITNKRFYWNYDFEDGFGHVIDDNGKHYYIDKNGKLYDENKKPIQENKSIDLMKRMMLL